MGWYEKRKVTITVDEGIIRWIEREIARKRFASLSHAVEFVVTKLMKKESTEKCVFDFPVNFFLSVIIQGSNTLMSVRFSTFSAFFRISLSKVAKPSILCPFSLRHQAILKWSKSRVLNFNS